jgi:hypothetical protein
MAIATTIKMKPGAIIPHHVGFGRVNSFTFATTTKQAFGLLILVTHSKIFF